MDSRRFGSALRLGIEYRANVVRHCITVLSAATLGLTGSAPVPGSAAPSPGGSNILSYSVVRQPIERVRFSDGSTVLLLTSFCSEQIGSGVEILVQGYPSGSLIEASINDQTMRLAETSPGLFTHIRISNQPDHQVVVTTPDGGRATTGLAGCS